MQREGMRSVQMNSRRFEIEGGARTLHWKRGGGQTDQIEEWRYTNCRSPTRKILS